MRSTFLILFAAAFAVACVLTWATRWIALRCELVSLPNPIVPQHTKPVAHLGGLGLAAGAAVVMFVAPMFSSFSPAMTVGSIPVGRLAVGGLAFLALGVVDDLLRLSAFVKLGLQVLSAAFAVTLGVQYQFTGLAPVDSLLSVGVIVLLVNSVNVTDVCDGLVIGIMLVTLSCWAWFEPTATVVALVLAGACLGFLLFNFPPASIFLGNTGSQFLGFALAALLLASPHQHGWFLRPLQMVLFTGPFLFETFLLIRERRRKGLVWWRGSPDHFSLRLQASGLSRVQDRILRRWQFVVFCCRDM